VDMGRKTYLCTGSRHKSARAISQCMDPLSCCALCGRARPVPEYVARCRTVYLLARTAGHRAAVRCSGYKRCLVRQLAHLREQRSCSWYDALAISLTTASHLQRKLNAKKKRVRLGHAAPLTTGNYCRLHCQRTAAVTRNVLNSKPFRSPRRPLAAQRSMTYHSAPL
jgi:hypothetical protein